VGGLVILRRSQVSAVAGILGINFSIALLGRAERNTASQ
jgi:hypothetical protein